MLALTLAVIGTAVLARPAGAPLPPATGQAPGPVIATGGVAPAVPTIRHGVLGVAEHVNPMLPGSQAGRDIGALVFAGLVRLGEGNRPVPDLAEGWTLAPDGRTWTFRLRDDARWHDGAPVVARDVVFTVERLRDPGYTGPHAGSWAEVTATEIDARTVRFELATPLGGFLDAARQPILPSHLLGDIPAADLPDHPFTRRPVGAGPYRLVSLDDERAVLEPAHGAGDAGPSGTPGVEPLEPSASPPRAEPARPPDRPHNVEVRFFPDAPALADAWRAGTIDLATGLPGDLADRLATRTDSRVLRYPTATLTAVVLNLRPVRPELRDPATRRALLQGIDRPALIDDAWDGQARVAHAPIPPESWAFDPAASSAIAYDRRAAARALDEAGWTPGGGRWTAPGEDTPYELELLSPDVASNRGAFEAASHVAKDWERLGLTVRHVPLPPAELIGDRLRTGAFQAAVLDITIGLDPDLYGLLASSQTGSRGLNLGGVVDPALDRLLAAARAPAPGEARLAAFRALQERLADQQYLLPLAFRDELVLVRDTVSGVTPRPVADPGDRFWDVLAWRLAAGR